MYLLMATGANGEPLYVFSWSMPMRVGWTLAGIAREY
jgi:hypothetical protein